MTGPRVVVIGGGISGLAAAHQLRDLVDSVDITVVEKSPIVGGKLRLHDVGGLTLDAGAESVLARRPEAVDLIEAVGLGADLVSPAQVGAGVWIEGGIRPLPKSQLLGIPYEVADVARSGILDEEGLVRLRADEALPATPVDRDVSVGSLVRDRMGQQVVDRLVEPLLGGVYAGNADDISLDMALPGLIEVLRSESSLMAAVRTLRAGSAQQGPVFASVRGGLGRLPGAVANASGATLLVGTAAVSLRRNGESWEVPLERGAKRSWVRADAVVLACEAPSAARLVGNVAPLAADGLSTIEYASVALVTLVFDGVTMSGLPPGTGFLVPPGAHGLVKAVTYATQKWSWVADKYAGRVVVRASVGRFGDSAGLDREDAVLVSDVLAELLPMIGATSQPTASVVTRWNRSLPQYRVGHRGLVAQIREALKASPGLEVCGAAVDGVGIPSCIASGQAAATRVGEFLRGRGD